MDDRQSRREFMGLTAVGVAGLLAPPWLRGAGTPSTPGLHDFRTSSGTGAVPGPDPDLVVLNARVYTMDAAAPRAEAFAVSGGRFIAVGSSADDAGAGRQGHADVIDAKGMTVVPGFIDCHNHAGGTTLLYDVLVGNPYEVEFVTIASIVEKLRARAQQTPAGMWVEGFFFDDTKLKDNRPLNRHDLDKVSTSTPSWCAIAAGIPRSTTARRWRWRASRGTRRTRPAGRSTGTPTAT